MWPFQWLCYLQSWSDLQLLLFRKTGDHCREPPQPPFSLIPASASPPPHFLSHSRPVDVIQTVILYPKTSYPQEPSLTFCLFSMESSTSVLHWLSLPVVNVGQGFSILEVHSQYFLILATIMAFLSYLIDLLIKAVWIAIASLLLIKDETWPLLLSVDSMSPESTIFLVTESNFPALVKINLFLFGNLCLRNRMVRWQRVCQTWLMLVIYTYFSIITK